MIRAWIGWRGRESEEAGRGSETNSLVVVSGDTRIEHDVHIFVTTIGRLGISDGRLQLVTPVHFKILFGISIRSNREKSKFEIYALDVKTST